MNVDVSQPAFNVLAGPPNPRLGMFALRRIGWGQRTPRTPLPRLRVALPQMRVLPLFRIRPLRRSSPSRVPLTSSLQPRHLAPPPLVYTSIPVDRFRLDIRPLAPRRLLPLALGLLVLLLLSQPARAASHRVQASPHPFRLLTSQGTAGTQPTRSLSRRDMQPPRPSPLPGNRPGQAYSQIRQFAHIQPAPMVPKMTHVQKPPTSPSPPFPTRPKAYKGQ
jgi:hypothetical protein